MSTSPVIRWLLIAAGLTSVSVGVIGIFVPLLPTTVFLIIGAACFARSSDRMYDWLTTHRWFGAYIRNYREHRAITPRAKAITLVMLWVVIGFSIYRVADLRWLQLLLLTIACGVTLLMLRLKTMTPEMMTELHPAAAVDD